MFQDRSGAGGPACEPTGSSSEERRTDCRMKDCSAQASVLGVVNATVAGITRLSSDCLQGSPFTSTFDSQHFYTLHTSSHTFPQKIIQRTIFLNVPLKRKAIPGKRRNLNPTELNVL